MAASPNQPAFGALPESRPIWKGDPGPPNRFARFRMPSGALGRHRLQAAVGKSSSFEQPGRSVVKLPNNRAHPCQGAGSRPLQRLTLRWSFDFRGALPARAHASPFGRGDGRKAKRHAVGKPIGQPPGVHEEVNGHILAS